MLKNFVIWKVFLLKDAMKVNKFAGSKQVLN